MIHEISSEIRSFLIEQFSNKSDFEKLCEACNITSRKLTQGLPEIERIKNFILLLEQQSDDYIKRLYESLIKLKPGRKTGIDKLFNLKKEQLVGFDSTLHECLTEYFNFKALKTLCTSLDIPEKIVKNIIENCITIDDASIELVYYSKAKGLQDSLIKYIKEKSPKGPLIEKLEHDRLEKTENLVLISIPFLDKNERNYRECMEVVGKFFTTNTDGLYFSFSHFSPNKTWDYCEYLRDSIDEYKALIFIIGENLELHVKDWEIKKFENEFSCAFFREIPIYIFSSEESTRRIDSSEKSYKIEPHIKRIFEICQWQRSTTGDKSPIIYNDISGLISKLSQVNELVLRPIVGNYNLPPVTPETIIGLEDRRNKIFICYSHKDTKWLKEIKIHLKALKNQFKDIEMDVWDDTRIEAGSKWNEKINYALDTAKIALLLISTNFLASDFIHKVEVPHLLKAAEENKTVILLLIIGHSLFDHNEDLSEFQTVNAPDKPLCDLKKGERDKVLVYLAERIKEILGDTNVIGA